MKKIGLLALLLFVVSGHCFEVPALADGYMVIVNKAKFPLEEFNSQLPDTDDGACELLTNIILRPQKKVLGSGNKITVLLPDNPEKFMREVLKRSPTQCENSFRTIVFTGAGKMPKKVSTQKAFSILEKKENTMAIITYEGDVALPDNIISIYPNKEGN